MRVEDYLIRSFSVDGQNILNNIITEYNIDSKEDALQNLDKKIDDVINTIFLKTIPSYKSLFDLAVKHVKKNSEDIISLAAWKKIEILEEKKCLYYRDGKLYISPLDILNHEKSRIEYAKEKEYNKLKIWEDILVEMESGIFSNFFGKIFGKKEHIKYMIQTLKESISDLRTPLPEQYIYINNFRLNWYMSILYK